jgi:hypothetical protein
MASDAPPVIEEVMWVEAEVSATNSSSGDDTNVEGDEEIGGMDPRESTQSYDFGPSAVTIRCIRQLEALGYFVEGSAHELGEEVIPEPVNDEAIMFEEFFAAGLRMPPQPALADILVKYHVQIHQLTPDAFTQVSKYFWVVMSFGG